MKALGVLYLAATILFSIADGHDDEEASSTTIIKTLDFLNHELNFLEHDFDKIKTDWSELEEAVYKLELVDLASVYSPEIVQLVVDFRNEIRRAKSLYRQSTSQIFSWTSYAEPMLEHLVTEKGNVGNDKLIKVLKLLARNARENFNLVKSSTSGMKELVSKAKSTFEQLKSNINYTGDKGFFEKIFESISSFFGFGKKADERSKEELAIQASFKVVDEPLNKLITQISNLDTKSDYETVKVIYDEIEALKVIDYDFKDKNAIIADKIESLNDACMKYKNSHLKSAKIK